VVHGYDDPGESGHGRLFKGIITQDQIIFLHKRGDDESLTMGVNGA